MTGLGVLLILWATILVFLKERHCAYLKGKRDGLREANLIFRGEEPPHA